jgi:succinate dehydrogenase / fumarate reductase flavoprotein subunit
VFGKLAGDGAVEYVHSNAQGNISQEQVALIIRNATGFLNRAEGHNPFVVHERLQEIMQNHVGIVRDERELKEGISKLQGLKNEISKVKASSTSQYNPGWNMAIDLQNLIITGEAVARAALLREESRGAHTRLDFEEEREEGLTYNVIIRKGANGIMEARREKRPAPPKELFTIAQATLEELEGSHA